MKNLLFAALAVVLMCVPAFAQPSVLGSETGPGGANGFTLGPYNTGSANFFAFLVSYEGSAPTVSDSASNTWIGLTACGTGNNKIRTYYAYNATPNASHSFTVTGTSSVSSGVIFWASGVKTSADPFDDDSCGTVAQATRRRGGQVLPTENSELIITGVALDNGPATVTVDSGFTNQETRLFSPGTHYGVSAASRVATYVNTYNPQFVLDSQAWSTAYTATFKAASPGGGSYTAQDRTPANCDDSTIQSTHDNDVEYGDTLKLPSCTTNNSFATTVNFYKSMTFGGNGCTGGTVLSESVNTACNSQLRDALASNIPMLAWELPTGLPSRITGIEFIGSDRGSHWSTTTSGIISIVGNMTVGTTMRVDNNIFDHMKGVAIGPNTIRGVMDHNNVKLSGNQYFYYCYSQFWSSSTDPMGHTSWADALNWGSADWLFAEDNAVSYDIGSGFAGIDGTLGCRNVMRFNNFQRMEPEAHGTDTGGNRGTRAIENYMNTYTYGALTASALQGLRSGSALVWGNVATSSSGTAVASRLVYDRCCATLTLGIADGENQFDRNDAGNPFNVSAACSFGASGKECKATGSGTLTVTVSGANFGDLTGKTIHKTVGSCSGNCASTIESNTSTTITYHGTDGHNEPTGDLTFSVNDQFEINVVTEGVDQPGVGGGGLLSGNPPSSVPGGWPDQVDTPVYEWLNTDDDASVHTSEHATSAGFVRENEHYMNYAGSVQSNNTTPFNGSNAGGGVGTIANRPTSCMTGRFYWATDEGEWNSVNPGVDGKMYICTATDTWTARYGSGTGNTSGLPYTYPHPLTVQSSTAKPGFDTGGFDGKGFQ